MSHRDSETVGGRFHALGRLIGMSRDVRGGRSLDTRTNLDPLAGI